MANGNDRSRWNWLLAIPVALPLATFLFNFDGPRVGGFPMFYWLQLAFVGVGVLVTTLVYQLSKRCGDHVA